MPSVHIINRREGIGLIGLTQVAGRQNIWRSCCWAFSKAEAETLVGGWIYLHPDTKSKPSQFGGHIVSVEPAHREGAGIEDGWAFVFEARKEGRDMGWRGDDRQRAWTSGIIESDAEHEAINANRP